MHAFMVWLTNVLRTKSDRMLCYGLLNKTSVFLSPLSFFFFCRSSGISKTKTKTKTKPTNQNCFVQVVKSGTDTVGRKYIWFSHRTNKLLSRPVSPEDEMSQLEQPNNLRFLRVSSSEKQTNLAWPSLQMRTIKRNPNGSRTLHGHRDTSTVFWIT